MSAYQSKESVGLGSSASRSHAAMIRCNADGKYERLDQFSHNQLKKYQDAKKRGKTIGIMCRKHTSGSQQELRCSNCRRHRPLADFSRAARKLDGSGMCRECTQWTESSLPGTTPLPAPTQPRAPDEDDIHLRAMQQDAQYGAQQNDDEDEDEDGVTDTWADSSVDDEDFSIGRGHGSNHQSNSSVGGGAMASHGPASAPSASGYTTTTTVQSERPYGRGQRQPVVYNAVGPDGEMQRRVQSVVNPSDTASVATRTTARRGGWAKVPGRKTAPAMPHYLKNDHPDDEPGEADWDSDESRDSV